MPWLGDLQWLGPLFRREVKQKRKTELILLITPHIITTPLEGEYKTQYLMHDLSNHPYNFGHRNQFPTFCPPSEGVGLPPQYTPAPELAPTPAR